jgi:hypothetical protein
MGIPKFKFYQKIMDIKPIWPFAGFYENNLFDSNRLSNFVSIASAQGSKGNSATLSEGLISLGSIESGSSLRSEKSAKGQLNL